MRDYFFCLIAWAGGDLLLLTPVAPASLRSLASLEQSAPIKSLLHITQQPLDADRAAVLIAVTMLLLTPTPLNGRSKLRLIAGQGLGRLTWTNTQLLQVGGICLSEWGREGNKWAQHVWFLMCTTDHRGAGNAHTYVSDGVIHLGMLPAVGVGRMQVMP